MHTQLTPTPPQIENQKSKIENLFTSLLPASHLTLLFGDPGVGKSLLTTYLAAQLSRGEDPFPQIENQKSRIENPSTSFILSAEDSPQTIISRLASAGADPNFIQILDPNLSLAPPKPRSAHTRPPTASLIRGLAENLPKTKNPRLLIIDPLPAFLGTLDCPNPATIRRTLRPLLDLAHQHHLAVLGLTHLNKSPTPAKDKHNPATLLHRILGSLAYPALARSILLLAPDPQLPDRRILSQLKNNLAPLLPPLAFSISSTPTGPALDWEPNPLNELPTPGPEDHDPFQKSQLDEALNFLTTTLQDGPVPSTDLLKQSRSLGISPRTLARAKFHLQTHSFHHPQTNQWLTSLP